MMDAFLYPVDQSEPVFAQPPGHWRRRGACDTLVALASVPPGHGERDWNTTRAPRKGATPKDIESLVETGLGDSEGYTAWHYWAHGPHPEQDFERLRKLLPSGLEAICANNGETPCHRLLMRGADEAFVTWVKAFGLNPGNPLGKGGVDHGNADTHWHMLAWHGGAGRVEKLADKLNLELIDQVDGRGLTAMIIAAHRGTRKDLEQWLLLGAHPDIKDRGGNTLLHHVARYGDADWYGRMLDLGADDSIRNDRGQRPRDILEDRVKHGTPQEEEILRRHWEIAYFHKTHL